MSNPMTFEGLSKAERGLLLYIESRAVDNGSKLDGRQINKEDIDLLTEWHKQGLVRFGRVPFKEIERNLTHFCVLSNDAIKLAQECRRKRIDAWMGEEVKRWVQEKAVVS